MKILCCGDRDWANYKIVNNALKNLPQGTYIIHGACRGADRICAFIAHQLKLIPVAYPAKWNLYGKAAGPIRNKEMLEKNSDISEVYAFHNNINESKGTKNMIGLARAHNIPIKIFTQK